MGRVERVNPTLVGSRNDSRNDPNSIGLVGVVMSQGKAAIGRAIIPQEQLKIRISVTEDTFDRLC